MNKAFIILLFIFSFHSLAQQPEYFNFTDTTFKINAIKRIPDMHPGFQGVGVCCGGGVMLDSIAVFLKQHQNIVLELAVYSADIQTDTRNAEYFKSLLVELGVDESHIVAKGYGYKNHQLYSQKMINEEFKKSEDAGKKMFYANCRVELKILQH